MARQKNDGRGRLGGRAKGTPNKLTGDLREWIAGIIDGERGRFAEALSVLEPSDYVRVMSGLFGYVLPKQAPITPSVVIEKERAMLQDLALSLPDVFVERVAKRLDELRRMGDEDKARGQGRDGIVVGGQAR